MGKTRVSLFLPCLAETYFPEIGFDAIRLLEAAGCVVEYPQEQTCCGQPLHTEGSREGARAMARHFLAVFGKAECVVAPSGSCVLMVRKHYPELFAQDAGLRQMALELAARTFELSEFLAGRALPRLGLDPGGRATLHDSCQMLHGLGLAQEPRQLLGRVQNLELVEMERPGVCCGFGGTFMARFQALSLRMARDRLAQAAATGAGYLVMTEPGCMLNLRSAQAETQDAAGVEIVHLASLLAKGLDHV